MYQKAILVVLVDMLLSALGNRVSASEIRRFDHDAYPTQGEIQIVILPSLNDEMSLADPMSLESVVSEKQKISSEPKMPLLARPVIRASADDAPPKPSNAHRQAMNRGCDSDVAPPF